jgi:alpha-amylase
MSIILLCTALAPLASALIDSSHSPWAGQSIYFLMTDRFAPSTPSFGAEDKQCSGDHWCGGTLRGVIERLDYIQGMGFDALWITPVVDQVPADWGPGWNTDAYHGYWARNLYEIESRIGTKEDLKLLVDECHRRGMFFMLDTVANHMGPIIRENLTHFYPFNQASHYHTFLKPPDETFLQYAHKPCFNSIPNCWPGMSSCSNQTLIENCWFGDLGDLKQENPQVAQMLNTWIKEMVSNYSIDGIRLDTAPYIPKWYLKQFQEAAGVYVIGEATTFNISYLRDYQGTCETCGHVQGMFNFPFWHKMRETFVNGGPMRELADKMHEMESAGFRDTALLGNFVDNQDQPRFLNMRHDIVLLKNQLALIMLKNGIPMVYYGTEQAFAQDSQRASLWPYYDQSSELYLYLKKLNMIRKKYLPGGTWHRQRLLLANDRIIAFAHGDLVVIVTNAASNDAGQSLVCLPASTLQGTFNTFGSQPFASGGDADKLCVQLKGNHPAVLVPMNEALSNSEFSGGGLSNWQVILCACAVLVGLYSWHHHHRSRKTTLRIALLG